jgi:ribosome-associated translation inhibitor RaiA
MTLSQESFPVRIRTRWLDFSPALHWYAQRRTAFAFRRFAARVRRVDVVIADSNGPRGGDDKICEIEVFLNPAGSILVSARSDDPYQSVDRAIRRARASLRASIDRARDRSDRETLTRIA